jgi:uncharacterized protein (TIGR03437 family)
MEQVLPAWLTYTQNDTTYATALFANDNVLVAAPGVLPVIDRRPANSADSVVISATGLRPTNPPYPVGQVVTEAYSNADLSKIYVSVGGIAAAVHSVNMTSAGMFQVAIQVPDGIPKRDLPVTLQIAGRSTQDGVILSFSSNE